MGSRANLVILHDGGMERYYTHRDAQLLDVVLFWGPALALAWIREQAPNEGPWLDIVWAEGGVVNEDVWVTTPPSSSAGTALTHGGASPLLAHRKRAWAQAVARALGVSPSGPAALEVRSGP